MIHHAFEGTFKETTRSARSASLSCTSTRLISLRDVLCVIGMDTGAVGEKDVGRAVGLSGEDACEGDEAAESEAA